jgi:hypothetical protein
MNHRGTEITERILNLARTRLISDDTLEDPERQLSKISVLLCALCVSVVN